jgi:hypothetical protein
MLLFPLLDEHDPLDNEAVPVNEMGDEYDEFDEIDMSQPTTASDDSFQPSQSQKSSSSQASSNNPEVVFVFYNFQA